MTIRGAIRNPEHARQLRDFSGLQFERGITPTDIDGFVEFNGEVFIFFELKHIKGKMPSGQRMALERLVDAIAPPRKAILLIGRHETGMGDLIATADCRVAAYRYNGQWHTPQSLISLRDAIEKFINWSHP